MKAHPPRLVPAILAATVFSAAIHRSARAQTAWTDGVGDWFQPANWSNGVPNPASPTSFDAQINNGGIAQIFTGGASVRRITLGALAAQGGGLLLDAGSLNVTENLRLGESGGMGVMTIRNNSDVTAGVTILGVFSGSGLMTVSDNGSTLSSQTLIVGELASGTMVVREGADVSGFHISLANSSTSSFGSTTVTGVGSTLVADDTLWIGRTGVGELTVDTGGAVTAPTIDIGSNNFGSGLATITGAGSMLTSTNTLIVGNNGFGTMNVSAGGRVNSIAMGLGFMSGGAGTVTITGVGSRLVDAFNSITVGSAGSGVLNLADGGALNVGGGFGSVIVGDGASGFASTLRIGQGGAPGTLEAGSISLFRANSKLELNHTGVIALGMPISGPGSVTQIANGTTTLTANNSFAGPLTVSAGLLELGVGGRINNASDSNVAVGVGQVASVRINGAGSKWINTASTFIGSIGTGTVTVENGGELRSDVQLLVNRFANGNGTLTVSGTGSKAMTNGETRIADEGTGLVRVEAGGTLTSGSLVELARFNTGNASAVVSGPGSLWSIAGYLDIGRRGTGTLRIENGGRVQPAPFSTLVGDEADSKGTLQIIGAGSALTTPSLVVGNAAGSLGTVEIDAAGSASLSNSLMVGASGSGLLTVSGAGAVISGAATLGSDVNGNGLVTLTGAGSTWSSNGAVIVGNFGVGDVRISDGATFTAGGGGGGAVNLAAQPGSVGILRIGTGAAPGTLNAGSVVFGPGATALLSFNHTGALTFPIAISGTGFIHKLGAGTTTLTANNSYSVGTRIFDGVLRTNNPSGQGFGTGTISVETRFANLHFISSALAGSNSVLNNHRVAFFDSSSAGTSMIDNRGGTSLISPGQTDFFGNTTAASASIINRRGVNGFGSGVTIFQDNATASTSNITNEASSAESEIGGKLFFTNNARAGTATITNHGAAVADSIIGSAVTEFLQNSSAESATIRNRGSAQQFGQGGFTNFRDTATAGASQITNERGAGIGSFGFGGEVDFFGSSRAGTATIINQGGNANGAEALLDFGDTASADHATITNQGAVNANNGGLTRFFGSATAGQSTLTMESATGAPGSGGRIWFFDTSTAGSATLRAKGGVIAGGPGQSGALGGAIQFFGSSNAGNAMVFNERATAMNALGGTTTFFQNSTAGSATITTVGSALTDVQGGVTNNGVTEFRDASTAGSATLITQGATATGSFGGVVRFTGSANGGSATFNNLAATIPGGNAGTLNFEGNASAHLATINNRGSVAGLGFGGHTFFLGAATAGSSSTILNEGGTSTNFASGATFFFASSSAGSATITATGGNAPNAIGGAINFFDNSTANNAMLTALGGTNGGLGGRIYLEDTPSGGNAAVTVQGNGSLTIENLLTTGTTLGSIAGSGNFLLGSKNLTVGSNHTSTVVSGSISGVGGSLTKVGTGTLTLSGTSSFTGLTTINTGALKVNGSLAGPVLINPSATLGGNGTTGPVNNSGGTLAPGSSPGPLAIVGGYTHGAGSVLEIEIASTSSYDRLSMSGAAVLQGGTLSLSLLNGFRPQAGNLFDIVTFGSRSGEFNAVVGDYLGEGLFFDPVYASTKLTLVTTQAGPGDTDLDGDVDLSDLGNLATSFGVSNATIDWINGDFDSDNDVDLNDLGTMATFFGGGKVQAYAEFEVLTPEPAGMLILALLPGALRRRLRPSGRPSRCRPRSA